VAVVENDVCIPGNEGECSSLLNKIKSIMGKSAAFLCFVLLVAITLISGCTDSPLTGAVAPSLSQPSTDYELIHQGITAAETECIGDVPRGASTEICTINASDTEKLSNAIILKLKQEEQNCLEDLPRRLDARLCTVKETDKTLVGKTVAQVYTTHRMYGMEVSIDESVDRGVRSSISLPYKT
jgi:hypothetical protein